MPQIKDPTGIYAELVQERTQSIMLEDYSAMEVLMKKFLILAPSISAKLSITSAEDLKLSLAFQNLTNSIQNHLES